MRPKKFNPGANKILPLKRKELNKISYKKLITK